MEKQTDTVDQIEILVPDNYLEIADMKLRILEKDYERTIQAENTAKPLLCEDDISDDENI